MNLLSALFLGILQGLTEFLPISSSGHLAIAQRIIGNFNQPGILFDVFLHAGTLCAILFYFRLELVSLIKKYFWMLAIGSFPAALIGFYFESQVEKLFLNISLVGVALLITAFFNYLTDIKVKVASGKLGRMTIALLVGIFQAFAIIPGISRSGLTIFAGSKFGFLKKEAAIFSFLLSIPAVLGANLLQFLSYGFSNQLSYSYVVVGFISALVVGYFSIRIVFQFLGAKKFKYFSYYCAILGISTLLLG